MANATAATTSILGIFRPPFLLCERVVVPVVLASARNPFCLQASSKSPLRRGFAPQIGQSCVVLSRGRNRLAAPAFQGTGWNDAHASVANQEVGVRHERGILIRQSSLLLVFLTIPQPMGAHQYDYCGRRITVAIDPHGQQRFRRAHAAFRRPARRSNRCGRNRWSAGPSMLGGCESPSAKGADR